MLLKRICRRRTVALFVFIFVFGFVVQSVAASTISGFVYDKQRNRLPEVDVELLNDFYQMLRRTKTDSAGRYEFGGLNDGNYNIRVLPFRYDLEDQQIRIEINTFDIRGGQGNTYLIQDFYLLPKKGGIADAEVGVIFAQEIPDAAKVKYQLAVKEFVEKRHQLGVDALFEALKIYPDYFDALYRMGKELYILGKYDDAWKYLLRSTEINPKSGPSFYYMGYSFYKLGPDYQKAAITSLTQASILTPNSMRIFFALGMVERAAGKYEQAEKHLLQAKKLADKPIPEIQKELVQLYGNDLKKYNEAANELEHYMKAGKMTDAEQKATKATIQKWREKAKSQVGKS